MLHSACSFRGNPEPGPPSIDIRGEALRVEFSTRIKEPARLVFRWRASEPDFRGRGWGVARVEPEHRARIDLFLDNGETAAIAALVGGELRAPPELDASVTTPPAVLMWAILGVFRPGDGAEYQGGHPEDDGVRVSYRLEDGRTARFDLLDRRVARAEVEAAEAMEEVELLWAAGAEGSSYPRVATYRHHAAFRELRFELDSAAPTSSFPIDIWDPRSP